MSSISETIALLKRVIADTNCSSMNRSTIKGYIGELFVKAKLENEGLEVVHLGNQHRYDLEAGSLRIDVKCSILKNEVSKSGLNWGWALIHENKKRDLSCTHVVCVAVDNKYDVKCYYVIPQAHIPLFPSGVGQFGGVRHALIVGNGRRLRNINKSWRAVYKKSEQLIQRRKAIRVGRNGNLSRVLLKTI